MRLALVMHSPLGAAFNDCATHVLGSQQKLEYFDILPNSDPDYEASKILNWVLTGQVDQPIVILCDLYGATPFNISAKASELALAQGYNIELFTGANMCMLLKALTESPDDFDLFVQKIYQGAQRGIVKIDTP